MISQKNLTLINSLNARHENISISNGAVTLKRDKEINIDGNFNSQFNLSENLINKLFFKDKVKFLEKNKVNAKGSLLHSFYLKIDENFKLVDYDYKSNGQILESQIILTDKLENKIIEKPIKNILMSKTKLIINLNKKNNNLLSFEGLYNLGGKENKKFKIDHNLSKKNPKYFIDFDLAENIFLEFIK